MSARRNGAGQLDSQTQGTATSGPIRTGGQIRESMRAPADSSPFVSTDPSPFTITKTGEALAARRLAIALAAYYRAERRGFAPGHEVEDWLVAEREFKESFKFR